MRTFTVILAFAALAFTMETDLFAQDWANLGRFRAANEALGPRKGRIVFMGDSITEGWSQLYPSFFRSSPYVNRGISGQTTPQMLVRFRPDVIDLQPDAVVLLAGTNDIAGNTGPATLEEIAGNIASMAELARAHGIGVIISSVLPAADYPWRPGLGPDQKIPALNALLRRYADAEGFTYLDYFEAMTDGRNGLLPEYTEDGVHPNRAGYVLMSALAFDALSPWMPRAPVPVIFDTDIGGDADDLGALAMLHHLVNSGEADLLAVMSWSVDSYAVPAIDGLNRFYGHPDIPIGARKDGISREEWMYNKAVADVLKPEKSYEDVPETTSLYRRILDAQPDSSVTLVTVGPLLNIERLLASPPDSLSPLGGEALVARKVREVVVMGGHFPEGNQEWNFWGDMPGVTQRDLARLKVPTVFSGFEVGEAIRTGSFLNDEDPSNPLHAGFLHFSKHAPWMKDDFRGVILDNASFDQTAVLYAVRGGAGRTWDRIEGGRVEVDENGDNRWVPGPAGHQSYLRLKVDPEQIAREIENLMLGRTRF